MKRLIAAVSLAVLAGPALALEIGKPFEQLDIDRALPNIPEREATAPVYPLGGSAPYEQLAVDRALPDIVVPGDRTQFAATAGETRSDASADVAERAPAESPFADQHDVIAPAP